MVMMLYINIPSIYKISALLPINNSNHNLVTLSNPGISKSLPGGNVAVPGIHVVDPDPTPYKCDSKTKKCTSDRGDVADAIQMENDWKNGKICQGSGLVCTSSSCTCDF